MVRQAPIRTSLALWTALAATLAACGGPPDPPPPPQLVFNLDRLYYDNSGGLKDSLSVVLRDPANFDLRWTQATSLQPVPPQRPTIDFTRQMVAVVGTGPMRRGAEVRLDSAAVQTRTTADVGEQEVLVMYVTVTQGCPGSNVSWYPLEFVSLPRYDQRVEFREELRPAATCSDRTP